MPLNSIFTGWRQTTRVSTRHYYMNGRSLCERWKIFTDSPDIKGSGRNCAVCLRRKVEMNRKAA